MSNGHAVAAVDDSFAEALVSRLSIAEQRAVANRAAGRRRSGAEALNAAQRAAVTRGLESILSVARGEGDGRALCGLTLLSHAASDDGFDVAPLPPTMCVRPERRVGLRDVVNEPRRAVIADARRAQADSPTMALRRIDSADAAVRRRAQIGSDGFPSIAATSLVESYKLACLAYGVRPNSGLVASLTLQWDTLSPNDGGSLDSASVTSSAAASGDFSRVRVIDASGLLLADKGVLPLLELARRCPNLQALHLDGNGLTNAAAEYVSDFCLSRAAHLDDMPWDVAPTKLPLSVTFAGNPRLSIGAGLVLVEAARACGPDWLRIELPIDGTAIPLTLLQRAANLTRRPL